MATRSEETSRAARRRWGALSMVVTLIAAALVGVGASAPVAATTEPSTVSDGPSLATAVRDAKAGDTILLQAGTFALTTTLVVDKNLTIKGVGRPDASVVTIASGLRASVIKVTSNATVTVEGVTITGGNPRGDGGGVLVDTGATLRLLNSTVRGNKATEGGGIHNSGRLEVDSSTIVDNNARSGGGGLRNVGEATVVNSTFDGNVSTAGSATLNTGTIDLAYTTIVRNSGASTIAGNTPTPVRMWYSIIGDNRNGGGSDCSGSVQLGGLNLVTNERGCAIVAADAESSIIQTTKHELGVEPLADNGGATLTAALAEGSPAIDAVTPTDGVCPAPDGFTVGSDQRGESRPGGSRCDLGSFERVANFNVTLDLDVDPGTVEVGVSSIAISELAKALNAPVSTTDDDAGGETGDETGGETLQSAGVRNIGVRNIGVRNIGVRNIGVRNIGVRNIGVRNIGVRNIGVRNIGVRNIALKKLGIDTFLNTIPLSEIPLLGSVTDGLGRVPDGWKAYLAGTQYDGVPLQSLTIEQLEGEEPTPLTAGFRPFDKITLEDIDLSNSVLGEIALRSAALADVPLGEIPPPADTTWCDLFAELCDQIGSAELLKLDLLSVQLAGGDVDAADVATIPMEPTLRNIGVRNIGVRNITIESAGVRNINIQNSGVRNIGVRNIGVRNIGVRNIDLLNCSVNADWCDGDFTLGSLPPEAFNPDATVGEWIDALLLGAESFDDLLRDLSLADFLALFVPNEQVPWERIDLANTPNLQNLADPAQPTFDYEATVEVLGVPATSLKVTVQLPKGFLLAGRPNDKTAKLSGGTMAATLDMTPEAGGDGSFTYTFPDGALGVGKYTLRVPVRAGLVTGDFLAGASVAAVGPGDVPLTDSPTDEATITVVPVDDGAGTKAVPLTLGDLQLAHISSGDDVDLFSFEAPSDGGPVRVLLSNIPEGVDYDLSIYAKTPLPLRGKVSNPAGVRTSLADVLYDLNPSDDIFPTDLADDIDLDVLRSLEVAAGEGYQLRAISSRRSNAEEEVALPAVIKGQTYYVAVTSYLGDSSDQPYGIRVRLDGAGDLRKCLPGRSIDGTKVGKVPTFAPATENTNTLYVTNFEWLANDFGNAKATKIIEAALATGGFANSPVIDPAIIDVSRNSMVKTAYEEWAEYPCDVERRNDVVRAIGKVLDGVGTDKVENIVILGGDGVIPMGAIPDLTGYSNEATAAQDVLTKGENNPVSAALTAGYFLSDDPYGTSAGIALRNAGHQLYLPEISVGRLVETGDDILRQLENFVEFKGRLDPGTATSPSLRAAVTAYDFLTDGGQAIARNLRAGVGSVVTSRGGVDLLGDKWDRDDYLALLKSGRFDILSPNAHYDWEALLPAAADGTLYSKKDLVFSSDVAEVGLERTLLFTIGCHAGLSVNDVQLGFDAPDWAQTFAQGDNQYIAHTTYGYGDDEIVAYSERLAAIFASQLSAHLNRGSDAPTSLGDVMVRTKQEFLATTFTLTPYDEKILQSWTYYGMPMYRIGGADDGGLSTSALSSTTSPGTFGATTTVGGNTVTPVSFTLNRTRTNTGPRNLNRVTTPAGNTYYEVGGNTITAQHRPVQPLVSLPVPSTVPAAGFVITELTSVDERPSSPLYLQPRIDLSGNERSVVPADGSFPSNLHLVTTDADGRQRLLLAAGQFQGGRDGEPDLQRLFTAMSGDLYHSKNSDGIGPRIDRVDAGEPGASGSIIEVTTDGTAKRVVVLYQTGLNGKWNSINLDQSDNRWTGLLPPNGTSANVEFLVQAVDDQGDVGISVNKVRNFFETESEGDDDAKGGELTITVEPADPNTAGWYKTDVTVTITAGDVADFNLVSLNTEPVLAAGSCTLDECSPPSVEIDPRFMFVVDAEKRAELQITVTEERVNDLFVRDSSGRIQFVTVAIDKTRPTADIGDWPLPLFANLGAFPPALHQNAVVTVTADCVDPAPDGRTLDDTSGVKACVLTQQRVNPTVSDVPVVLKNGQLDTSEVGTFDVTITAIDNAGNPAESVTKRFRVYDVCERYDTGQDRNSGSGVPIKLQVCDENGVPSPENGLLVLSAIAVVNETTGTTFRAEPEDAGNANADFAFRFSAAEGVYIFNLKTDPTWGVGEFLLGLVTTPSSLSQAERSELFNRNGWTYWARFQLK
jgi:hypothetical protein